MDGQGFKNVYNLAGGIKSWTAPAASGPPDLGLFLLSGDETASDLARTAYGLESGLLAFYEALQVKAPDAETADLFARLAGFEKLHQDRVYEIFSGLEPSGPDRADFEESVGAHYLEGGVGVEEFLAEHQGRLAGRADILDLALSIEAQALDLYLRFTRILVLDEARRASYDIAQDEKKHLAALEELRARDL